MTGAASENGTDNPYAAARFKLLVSDVPFPTPWSAAAQWNAATLPLVILWWYGGDGPHLLARRLMFGLLSEMETTLTPISSGMDFTT